MKDVKLSITQECRLWVLLSQARDLMVEAMEAEMSESGVTAVQGWVLFIIKSLGGATTPAEIAKWMLRRPNSVSAILSRMAKIDLVKVGKDQERRGMLRVTMTEKGEQTLRYALKRETVGKIVSSLPDEAQKQLISYLETLRNSAFRQVGFRSITFP